LEREKRYLIIYNKTMAIDWDKISSLTTWTPTDSDWLPYVDIVAWETKKATKLELKWDTWPQWPVWPQWYTWPQWPTWPQGLIWQWAYDSTVQYYTNDAVSNSWNSYIAIQNTKGNAPTDTTYWNLIAKKGADWSGSWDMVAATYDPNNIAADCFSQDNMENWTTNVNYTKTEQSKLSWIATWANVNVQADYNQTDNTQDNYIKNKPDLTVYEITADKVTAWQSTPDDIHYPSEKLTKDSLDWKEPTITKNTAFNKNFWTTAWTVLEWNTNVGIVWTKTVDETNIADKTIIQYDSANNKYVCVAPPSWWSWWGGIWVAPVTKYAWSLTIWVFDEIQAPSAFTLTSIKATLENIPAWTTAWTDDITTVVIDYTTDWTTWTNLWTATFTSTDTLTAWIDILNITPSLWSITENTRIRFNTTTVGSIFAGSNLKIYFK